MKTYLIHSVLALALMMATSCISIGGGSHTPSSTTTVTEKTVPLSNPGVTQTTQTTTRTP